MSDPTTLKINGQSYIVKRAVVAAGTTANRTGVAAVSGKKIRVVGLLASCAGAAAFRLESTSGGDALTPVVQVGPANSARTLEWSLNPYGWAETNAGELLNIEHTGAGTLGYVIQYIEV